MIGHAEQVNVEQGLSSGYARQNCCQDSFAVGYLSPELMMTVEALRPSSPFAGEVSPFWAD